ncbi:MAG: hypothetical protein PHP28_08685 [Actinomycetota bacterium]|nr:hypothetical protein [Actinomycetota bacterium]MDD5666495.1 hypothetical protein [Actinomycetota bacterium]
MGNVPGAYCPFRVSAITGALSPCNDECSLYIPTSKMPAQKSCALSILGVYALQRIIFKQQGEAEAASQDAETAPAPPADTQ